MQMESNYPLSKLTTFRIGGEALWFVEVANESELVEALNFAKEKSLPILILGGGSNVLVSDKGFAGLVIKVSIKGKDIISENDQEVWLKIGSGEIWDEVVEFAVAKNYWGLENLSNIPGFTGGVPVQNVGAYGQESSQIIETVEASDMKSLEKKVFSNAECGFGYRTSKFNTDWKNKYVILSVTFKLSKNPKPNITYADVKKYFTDNANPTQTQIRQAIIEIRKNKFPDLAEFGTAGSFFKNLILSEEQYQILEQKVKENFGGSGADKLVQIKNKFPQVNSIKIPTAFLLDLCGLKGKSVGSVKLWEKQPLAIVNTGNAKASDVVELFQQVCQEVRDKTGMELRAEPEFVGDFTDVQIGTDLRINPKP